VSPVLLSGAGGVAPRILLLCEAAASYVIFFSCMRILGLVSMHTVYLEVVFYYNELGMQVSIFIWACK